MKLINDLEKFLRFIHMFDFILDLSFVWLSLSFYISMYNIKNFNGVILCNIIVGEKII